MDAPAEARFLLLTMVEKHWTPKILSPDLHFAQSTSLLDESAPSEGRVFSWDERHPPAARARAFRVSQACCKRRADPIPFSQRRPKASAFSIRVLDTHETDNP